MPWSDNANPGPWGDPPKGADDSRAGGPRPEAAREAPRRPPPPAPPPREPDLSEQARRLSISFGRMLDGQVGRGLRPSVIAGLVSALALAWAATGFYVVPADEEAAVIRLGAYVGSVGPGVRYHLPIPLERVERLPVTDRNATEIGGSSGAGGGDESLMLTADNAIVDINFTLRWHVTNAADYLFQVRDAEAEVKSAARSAMRQAVGQNKLTAILAGGQSRLEAQTLALAKRRLGANRVGVSIDAVQIENAKLPAEAAAADQDIAKAYQEAGAAKDEANAYRDKKLSEAKGQAAKAVGDAEAYRQKVVIEAQGQGEGFKALDAQYRKAPAITRERLYIDAMQTVLTRAHKVIVEPKGASAPIILPPQVPRPAAPTAPAPSDGNSP